MVRTLVNWMVQARKKSCLVQKRIRCVDGRLIEKDSSIILENI